MLQWLALHPCIYGKHSLGLVDYCFRKNIKLGGEVLGRMETVKRGKVGIINNHIHCVHIQNSQ